MLPALLRLSGRVTEHDGGKLEDVPGGYVDR